MLRVREIMTTHVVTLSPDATLRDAVETLVTCRIGGAPVLEGRKVVGVLSAPDILEFESITPVRPSTEEEAADAMPIDEEEEAWEDEDVAPSTFFTDLWSDNGPTVSERFETTRGQEPDFLADHTVGEAMSRAICSVPDNLEVSAAAQRMLAAGMQRALVTSQDALVGIVTTTDILRAVAEHRLTVRQHVFD